MNLYTILILWLSILLEGIHSRHNVNKFIISYVENERIPSMVVFNNVCWKKSVKVNLMKELAEVGIRSASSASSKTSLHDTTLLLVTDLDCPGVEEMFVNATRHDLHKLPYRWLVLTSSPIETASPWWHHFLVNSDLVVAEFDGERFEMTEVHKPSPTGSLVLTPRGSFNGVLTDVRPHRELYRRRRDLLGTSLIMTNTIQDSNATKFHLVQEDRLDLHNDFISKNSWTLGKLGLLMLNATPKAVFNYRYGYVHKGEWTGQIRDLMDNKAEIGTNIGITSQRLEAVSFIDNLDNCRVLFIFRKPGLSYTSNIYFLPFSSGVWIATAVSAAMAALALYLSVRLTEKNPVSLGDAFLLAVSAVAQQGSELQYKKLSARIIQWVTFATLMALYAAYAAKIVVLLQAPSNSINNLAQLAKSKITLAAHDVDYNNFIFKGATDPLRKAIAKKVDPEQGQRPFYSLAEGVERIRKEQFAFHVVTDPAYRQVEKTFFESEKCDLVEIDYAGYKKLYIPAYKHSPYLELFRVVYKQIREVGIKSAINSRLEAGKPSCKNTVAMFISVGVMEMRSVMLSMVYGVAISAAVALVEILVFHVQRYRRNSKLSGET
ncbi:ionotropic receptor 75a-like [Choristoneura fumiferana]|uniref:ionotropic receptor 75a-like n=1 Tax=Choristoneura fumiferana TaxID=7141 RepID=UPI003D159AFF